MQGQCQPTPNTMEQSRTFSDRVRTYESVAPCEPAVRESKVEGSGKAC
jgi:hypothetical protein